ncbi:MAG: AAA family ATPase [Angustibacter sp.]
MIAASPVLVATAVSDRYEAALVSGLDGEAGVRVVRRCADVADVLACAAAGLVQAVVVSLDLRGLDAGALEVLEHHGCGVVVLVDDPSAELAATQRRLRQSGVSQVLSAQARAAEVVAAARAAVATAGRGHRTTSAATLADPRVLTQQPGVASGHPGPGEPSSDPPVASGRVVAVWGPVGAPGRTTVAVELAAELAGAGQQVLLVDADTYGASVAQRLALLDESAAVAAACRAADRGSLDAVELARLAPVVLPRLRVLTGLLRPDRWPEVRAAALTAVVDQARGVADWVVVDTGFSLEQDEELSYDTVAPRRNQAALAALAAADLVVVVGSADPVGLQRLVRGVRELAEVREPAASAPVVVANRVRATAVGPNPGRQVREALQRYAGLDEVVLLPDDAPSVDAAVLAGRTLAEHARSSPLRAAVHDLVMTVRRRAGVAARDQAARVDAVGDLAAAAH